MSDKNLLRETVKEMANNGKSHDDVRWCGSSAFWFTWDEFAALAEKTNYYAGFGGAEVATDLVVVGDDWWLERHEYDGSEWWEFKTLPQKPDKHQEPKRLVGGTSWTGLSEMQGEEDEL